MRRLARPETRIEFARRAILVNFGGLRARACARRAAAASHHKFPAWSSAGGAARQRSRPERALWCTMCWALFFACVLLLQIIYTARYFLHTTQHNTRARLVDVMRRWRVAPHLPRPGVLCLQACGLWCVPETVGGEGGWRWGREVLARALFDLKIMQIIVAARTSERAHFGSAFATPSPSSFVDTYLAICVLHSQALKEEKKKKPTHAKRSRGDRRRRRRRRGDASCVLSRAFRSSYVFYDSVRWCEMRV